MARTPRRWLLSGAAMTIAAASVVAFGSPALAAPSSTSGNLSCSDIDPYYQEVKIDSAGGTATANGVTVTAESSNGMVTSWTSTEPVDAVIVKAGSTASGGGSAVYTYDPEATSGGDLAIPAGKRLSHISFCYDYELAVTNTVSTSFTRVFEWSIDKSVDQSQLTMAAGESGSVNYSVSTDRTERDTDWLISGVIGIVNETPESAVVTSVADVLVGENLSVMCPMLPFTLAPGESAECFYSAAPLEAITGESVATVETSLAVDTPVRGGTATAAVAFGEPDTLIGPQSINVDDVASDGTTNMFAFDNDGVVDYPRTYGCPTDPSAYTDGKLTYTVTNTATIRETGADDSATVTVDCTAPPGPEDPDDPDPEPGTGCTLTQGYWKTHSSYGPAPYDATWAGMEDDAFFLSGQTYYEVFGTEPAGNAYYQLAHQWIAAYLNTMTGASVPDEVAAALSAGQALLESYTPDAAAALTGDDRAAFIDAAGTLDAYNNGEVGPGHCS